MDWTISHANGRFYVQADLHDQESLNDFITMLKAISAVMEGRTAREMQALAAQYENAMAQLEHCSAQEPALPPQADAVKVLDRGEK